MNEWPEDYSCDGQITIDEWLGLKPRCRKYELPADFMNPPEEERKTNEDIYQRSDNWTPKL